MGFAGRLMIWIVLFNIAVSMTTLIFTGYSVAGLQFEDGGGPGAVSQINVLSDQVSTTGTNPVEEPNYIYNILNFLSVGFFAKIQAFFSTTLFAVPTLFHNLGILPTVFLTLANGIISFIIILGMFDLFTSKDLTQK